MTRRYLKTSHEIIRSAVTMQIRSSPSLRNADVSLHERGITICHQTGRFRGHKFRPLFAAEIRSAGVGMRSNH